MTPTSPSQHRFGIAVMVLCGVLWSTAGVAMRAASVTNGWEATFWRSLFLCGVVGAYLLARHRGQAPARLRSMGWHGAVSGVCWATMFTAFMLALSLTTVANTLVTMATMPFFAALAGRLFLGERIPPRTWAAMAAAAVGVAAMFHEAFASGTIAGSVVALAVPLAAAANTVTVKRARGQVDLVPALLVGGAISVALAAPFALPLSADARDLAIFAALALFQLALPCALLVAVAMPRLSAAEIGLLSLLEVVLGPLWVWLAWREHPGSAALAGGAVVIAALAANEAIALWRERRAAHALSRASSRSPSQSR
ncbi:MAG: DMT family transporter [Burkholderiales bacterium]|nr:DMT family transporter [Burkholderiales bacterium]